MANVKAMRDAVKAQILSQLMSKFEADGQDVGISGSAELNFPIVLEDGSEDFVVVKVVIPTGSRDGEAYDGYAMREEYELHKKAVAERKQKAAEAKAKKLAKKKKSE